MAATDQQQQWVQDVAVEAHAGTANEPGIQRLQVAGGLSESTVVPVKSKAAQVLERVPRKHTSVVPLHDSPVAATRAIQAILSKGRAEG